MARVTESRNDLIVLCGCQNTAKTGGGVALTTPPPVLRCRYATRLLRSGEPPKTCCQSSLIDFPRPGVESRLGKSISRRGKCSFLLYNGRNREVEAGTHRQVEEAFVLAWCLCSCGVGVQWQRLDDQGHLQQVAAQLRQADGKAEEESHPILGQLLKPHVDTSASGYQGSIFSSGNDIEGTTHRPGHRALGQVPVPHSPSGCSMTQQKRESVIDLGFAVQVLSAVWEQIEAKIIKNCFPKAGFVLRDGEDLDCVVADADGPDPGMWAAAEEAFGLQDFAAYVDADSELVSTEEITDEETVAQVANVPVVDHELDEDEEGDEDIAPRKATTAEALKHIQGLKSYFEQNMAPDAVRRLVLMESDIVSKAVTRATRSKLTGFFSKA